MRAGACSSSTASQPTFCVALSSWTSGATLMTMSTRLASFGEAFRSRSPQPFAVALANLNGQDFNCYSTNLAWIRPRSASSSTF